MVDILYHFLYAAIDDEKEASVFERRFDWVDKGVLTYEAKTQQLVVKLRLSKYCVSGVDNSNVY